MNQSNTEHKTELIQTEEQGLTQIEVMPNNEDYAPEFFPVSEGKLITLYILSFGLYGVYWFYKNWQLQQPKMEKKISPILRAIFSIFFTHALFRRIDEQAKDLDKKHRFNANSLATFFVAAVIVGNLLDRSSMHSGALLGMSSNTAIISSLIILILSAYPLAKVQATANRINNDLLGYLNHKYSMWNYLLTTFGTIAWLMMSMSLLAESMGFSQP